MFGSCLTHFGWSGNKYSSNGKILWLIFYYFYAFFKKCFWVTLNDFYFSEEKVNISNIIISNLFNFFFLNSNILQSKRRFGFQRIAVLVHPSLYTAVPRRPSFPRVPTNTGHRLTRKRIYFLYALRGFEARRRQFSSARMFVSWRRVRQKSEWGGKPKVETSLQ